MYVILVYDVAEERVGKMPRILRKYLKHVQRSVFEGNITTSNLEMMKKELLKVMDISEDSVRLYILRSENAFHSEVIGVNTLSSNIL